MNKLKTSAANSAKSKSIDHARLMEIIPNAFSPRLEKARLLKAINDVLKTKSNPALSAILASLEGISDKKIDYSKLKHMQGKIGKLLEQDERLK